MSIKLGFPNTEGTKVSDALAAQGINLLRSTASGCEAIVWVERIQVAYKQYTTFLPAFISAMNKGQKVRVDAPNHPLHYSGPLVTSDYPPLAISFPKNLPNDALEMLRGVGYYETRVKGATIYIIRDPDAGLVQKISKMGVVTTCPAPVNTVNFSCLYSLRTVRAIFSAFFRLHEYPAFRDRDHASLLSHLQLEEGEEPGKRKRTIGDQPGNAPKRGPAAQVPGEGEEQMEIESGIEEDHPQMKDVIKWAMPSTGTKGWVEDEQIPEGTGVFVQYVPDLAATEGERSVVLTVRTYFLGCLGSTTNEVLSGMEKIRTAMGIISKTDVGKVLNHMAWCIDVGIQAQARILPVLSKGTYHGCLLMGWGFTIRLKTGDFVPVENQRLISMIEDASPFGTILNAIANIVNDDVEDDLHIRVLGCTTAVGLRRVLLEANLSEDERTRIVTLCSKLRFSKTPHFGINTQHLARALHFIANPDEDIPDDYPILPISVFESDRVALAWSAFGTMAPTFMFAGGPKYDLESPKCINGHLGVRTVPAREAANDMARIVSQKWFVGTTNNRRSAVFKDRIFTGLDSKNLVESIRSACGVAVNSSKVAKEGKVVTGEASSVFDQF